MPVVYRGLTRGYTLTSEDVLWLARGFVGEAGEGKGDCSREEAQWLFWAWLGRFLLMPSAKWAKGSFSDLVRAHSQALSTLWDEPNDPKCQEHPDHCSSSAIARRARIRSKTQAQLEAVGVWQFALDARDGNLKSPTPKPIYDFAACKQSSGVNIGGNCFKTYEYISASSWQKPLIALDDNGRPLKIQVSPSAGSILKTAGWSAAGILAGYGIYTLWDRRRRK